MSSKQKEKFNKLVADSEAIFNKAKEEGREVSADEFAVYEKMKPEILALRKTMTEEKELAGMHFEENKEILTAVKPSKAEAEANFASKVKTADPERVRDAFNRFLKTGERSEYVITSGTDSGALIPVAVQQPIVVRKMWNAISQACLAMGTPIVGMDSDSTETITLPVYDDTDETGDTPAEDASSDTASDASVSTVTLAANLTSSKSLWFSNTLLKSPTYDLLSYLLPILQKRIDLTLDAAWTAKLLTGPTSGYATTTTASTTGLTYAEFVKWYSGLKPQFRVDGVFIISDGLRNALEGLTDSEGRPLINMTDSITTGPVARLRGCPVFISNSLLTPAANVVSGVFVSAGSLYPRVCGNSRIAKYVDQPAYPDQQGFRQFVNADFGISPGVSYLKHAAS